MARPARRVVKPVANDPVGIVGPTGSDGGDGNIGGGDGNEQFAGTVIIDPADIGGPDGSDRTGSGSDTGSDSPRRRGRKPGSRGPQKKVLLDVSGVEQLLFSIHGMLAGITKTPELMLAPPEAKTLAEGIASVSRHYDVSVGAKAMDWTNLAMIAGMVYGPRIVAYRNRVTRRGPVVAEAPRPAPASSPAPPASNSTKVNIPGIGEVDVEGTIQ